MTRGTLWVVATPIGNLEDMTLRGLRVLRESNLIACEDTRTTGKLLARHSIPTKMLSYHEHNEAQRVEAICQRLEGGDDVALVSDAGTPLLSDPGRKLVAAVAMRGITVSPIPGPSAILAALAVSGLATERFTFFGFAPVKGGARQRFLDDVVGAPATAVLFEAPHRIERTLSELCERAPERAASLHREMTKLHEETVRGSLGELVVEAGKKRPRGEYTLVVAAADGGESSGTLEEAVELARGLIADGATASAAAKTAAERTGVRRRAIYEVVAVK